MLYFRQPAPRFDDLREAVTTSRGHGADCRAARARWRASADHRGVERHVQNANVAGACSLRVAERRLTPPPPPPPPRRSNAETKSHNTKTIRTEPQRLGVLVVHRCRRPPRPRRDPRASSFSIRGRLQPPVPLRAPERLRAAAPSARGRPCPLPTRRRAATPASRERQRQHRRRPPLAPFSRRIQAEHRRYATRRATPQRGHEQQSLAMRAPRRQHQQHELRRPQRRVDRPSQHPIFERQIAQLRQAVRDARPPLKPVAQQPGHQKRRPEPLHRCWWWYT